MLSVGLVGVWVSPAAATPTDCEEWRYHGYGGGIEIRCNTGSGWYRAVAYCSATPTSNLWHIRRAVWREVGSGQYSSAICGDESPYYRGGYTETG